MKEKVKYGSIQDFYVFYLSQHQNITCRRLHFFGTTAMFILLMVIVIFKKWPLLFLLPVIAYGCAWFGHFFFEKNRPATFQYPALSFRADFRMYSLMWQGRMEQEIAQLKKDWAENRRWSGIKR